MVFFIVIILSLYFFPTFTLSQTVESKETCVLPFAVAPCITDGKVLSCTFSLNSSQRRNTCQLYNVSLIFTTANIELFIIPQYYNQIISISKHIISTLIIEPKIINETFEYLHWSHIQILSIEIPTDIYKFRLIHVKNGFDITRNQRSSNKTYWHLQMRLIQSGLCEETNFTMNNFTTSKFTCPYSNPNCEVYLPDIYPYVDNSPCYASGYRQIVCFTQALNSLVHHDIFSAKTLYNTIFISVYNRYEYALHYIRRSDFAFSTRSNKTVFVKKRVVILIDAGILQISPEIFNESDDFQIRIEHGSCNEKRFQVDILDDTEPSIINNLIEYTSNSRGVSACRLNLSDSHEIVRCKPKIHNIQLETQAYADSSLDIKYFLQGLPPFTLSWFRDKVLVSEQKLYSFDQYFPSQYRFIFGSYIIDHVTKDDNGAEYLVNVTNRCGQNLETTRLDVLYAPNFIVPPKNQTVKRGSNVTLEVEIDGNPMPNISLTWLNFHESLQPIDNQSFLYQYNLTNVQVNDSISYTFSISSEFYSTNYSKTIFLTVLGDLVSTNLTRNITIEEDENLDLKMPFSHDIVGSQWFINGTPLENTSTVYVNYIKQNQAILLINNISKQNNGIYRVHVWDVLNQTNESTVIVHAYYPSPTILNCSIETIPYRLVTILICRFQAQNPKIQWIFPTNKTVSTEYHVVINASIHIFETELVFKNLKNEIFGLYQFQVTNRGGKDNRNISLDFKNMTPRIGFTTFNLDTTIYKNQGESYNFTVFFDGVPWPNVTFFFNNKSLLSYSDPSSSSASFYLNNLTINQEGWYYARVMNSEGFVETNRTYIYIHRAPSFIVENQQSPSSILYVKRNENLTLVTPKIRTGVPASIELLWYIQNNIIKQPFYPNMSHSELTIRVSEEYQQIVCIARNQFGTAAHFFRLTFLQPLHFLLPLKEQLEIELHENLTLTICVISNSFPDIQWYHNQQIIVDKLTEQSVTTNSGIYSLIITNFSSTDIGEYQVIVTDSDSRISSRTFIKLKSYNFYFNATNTNTIESRYIWSDYISRIILIILMISLISILCIPIFCKQDRLLALFSCKKENINDDNNFIKNNDELAKKISPSRSNISVSD